MNITIAGHVDHGKSTLIGRILLDTRSLSKGKMEELSRVSRELGKEAELAYLADQLKEEREQERTIDTTQSFFKTRKRRYCIIDVPGHVEFLKNMITGATQADSAMLLIDAKAGIEEQTRRHAYIVGMIGIPLHIAVINKMDLVSYSEERFGELSSGLLDFTRRISAKEPLVIPISARHGDNITSRSLKMRWYKGPCLTEALDRLEVAKGSSEKPLRFAVQDSYIIDGERIIVGKVLSGKIAARQHIKLLPSSKDARVEAIKIFGGQLRQAMAGENVGLKLNDPSLAKRGEIICDSTCAAESCDGFRANIFWMSDRPLRKNDGLLLRCSTQKTECRAEIIERRINSSTFEVLEEDAQALNANEAGTVIFSTERPVIVERPDQTEELGRFVLDSGGETVGAGIIVSASRQGRGL
ncbi:MAG: GTP-binding protein [Candidatus Omnitrophica bacterium]|nr:GTP-binding protein [Candidatus Omnitrophota bacterium]